MLVCRLCEKTMNAITWRHLKKWHDITVDDYKAQFPNAIMRSVTQETRRKISASKLGTRVGHEVTDEARSRMSAARRGITPRYGNPELHRQRISESLLGNRRSVGRTATEETRNLLSTASKRNWRNPEYAKRVMRRREQTGPEKQFDSFIKEHNLPYRFVGNGAFMIENRNPDFVHLSQPKVIEIYGDYFHKNDDPQDRIDMFKEYGYDCLVFWASELNNKELKERVIAFTLEV